VARRLIEGTLKQPKVPGFAPQPEGDATLAKCSLYLKKWTEKVCLPWAKTNLSFVSACDKGNKFYKSGTSPDSSRKIR